MLYPSVTSWQLPYIMGAANGLDTRILEAEESELIWQKNGFLVLDIRT